MKDTNYLYGIDPKELENKFYFEALDYKRTAGLKLFKKLYFIEKRSEDEAIRLYHVEKAIKHTERLLDER